MQSITKYHRRIDDNPSHLIALLLQVTHYAEGRCHSKMQSPFRSLDAHGPCARMRSVRSGLKPSDTYNCAIYRFFCLQTTCRPVPSLLAKFHAIRKCHVHGLYLRMRLIQNGPRPSDTSKCAIYRFFCLQTTCRLTRSRLAKFQAILKCHVHGLYLRMHLI